MPFYDAKLHDQLMENKYKYSIQRILLFAEREGGRGEVC